MSTKTNMTAAAYGCCHMTELNQSLKPLTKNQAEVTIESYATHTDDGAVYEMVFRPSNKKTVKAVIAKAVGDVFSVIADFLKKVARLTEAQIRRNIDIYYDMQNKVWEVVVRCRATAKHLLHNGFVMLQFQKRCQCVR